MLAESLLTHSHFRKKFSKNESKIFSVTVDPFCSTLSMLLVLVLSRLEKSATGIGRGAYLQLINVTCILVLSRLEKSATGWAGEHIYS